MNKPAQNRIAYFDNLRFFLIMMVVIGHFIDNSIGRSRIYKSLFLWLWCFHMPLFIFLSGLFHKNQRILPRVMGFLMIGFVLKILLFLEALTMTGNGSLSYYGGGNISWFMFALAAFTTISYALRSMNKHFVLCFSIILGLFSGYDFTIGNAFFASRIIVFYPFFVLGEMCDPMTLLRVTRQKTVRLLGILILVAWAALCVLDLDRVYLLRPIFEGKNAFKSDMFRIWGGAYRALCYTLTLASGFGVMCLVPQRQLPIVSRFGSRTIQIYFWHNLVRDFLVRLQVHNLLYATRTGKLIWVLFAVLLTFFFGLKFFGFPTGAILKASRYAPEYLSKTSDPSDR